MTSSFAVAATKDRGAERLFAVSGPKFFCINPQSGYPNALCGDSADDTRMYFLSPLSTRFRYASAAWGLYLIMTLPLWGSTLYVASGDNRIYELSGSTYEVQAQLTANVANSRGMAIDAGGNLYVANVVQSSIVKFQSSVMGLDTTSSSYFLNPGSNGLINGLTFDASNNLYAASTLGILKFANDGSGLSSSYTTPFTGVQSPVSVHHQVRVHRLMPVQQTGLLHSA